MHIRVVYLVYAPRRSISVTSLAGRGRQCAANVPSVGEIAYGAGKRMGDRRRHVLAALGGGEFSVLRRRLRQWRVCRPRRSGCSCEQLRGGCGQLSGSLRRRDGLRIRWRVCGQRGRALGIGYAGSNGHGIGRDAMQAIESESGQFFR